MKTYTFKIPNIGWVAENIAPWGSGKIQLGMPSVTIGAEPLYHEEKGLELKADLVLSNDPNAGGETGFTKNGKHVCLRQLFVEDKETGEAFEPTADVKARVKFS